MERIGVLRIIKIAPKDQKIRYLSLNEFTVLFQRVPGVSTVSCVRGDAASTVLERAAPVNGSVVLATLAVILVTMVTYVPEVSEDLSD